MEDSNTVWEYDAKSEQWVTPSLKKYREPTGEELHQSILEVLARIKKLEAEAGISDAKLGKPVVAHYQAIAKPRLSKYPILTDTLYTTVEEAEADYGGTSYTIVRLATELEPIMLEVDSE